MEDLHRDLEPHAQADATFGRMLKHPLVYMPLPSPALHAMANLMYRDKRAKLDAAVAAGKWDRAINLHERPYRLAALLKYREQMPATLFWKEVASVYRESENVYELRDEWLELLGSAVPHREHLMSAAERRQLAALPEVVTIYRGSRREEPEDDLGLSWTTSKGKARWYATRFFADGYVFTATVAREQVLAVFAGEGNEIIVLPHTVKLIGMEPVEAESAGR